MERLDYSVGNVTIPIEQYRDLLQMAERVKVVLNFTKTKTYLNNAELQTILTGRPVPEEGVGVTDAESL